MNHAKSNHVDHWLHDTHACGIMHASIAPPTTHPPINHPSTHPPTTTTTQNNRLLLLEVMMSPTSQCTHVACAHHALCMRGMDASQHATWTHVTWRVGSVLRVVHQAVWTYVCCTLCCDGYCVVVVHQGVWIYVCI